MKRLAAPAALLAATVLVPGCSSGGPASPGGSMPRRVLVEVAGVRTEAEAFAARFLLEAEERAVALVDARLAGAHLADLADPNTESSRKLREAFPADRYLAAVVGPCQVFSRASTMPGAIDPSTGIRTTEVIGGRDVTCAATVTESGPDGKTLRTVNVDGTISLTGSGFEGTTEPSIQASQDAATTAAKRLWGKKR